MVKASMNYTAPILFLFALTPKNGFAFQTSTYRCPKNAASEPLRPLRAAIDDAAAQALSDYMTKSHLEKLRAVKEMEDKKNAEIKALQEELALLKSSGNVLSLPEPVTSTDESTAELENKLASYQQFLAEYIVNAQNQKLLAVKQAEIEAEKKFQTRLQQILDGSGDSLPPVDTASTAEATSATEVEPSLFEQLNGEIIAAAQKGKSDWDGLEVERAVEQAKNTPSKASIQPEPSLFELRNARIIAAAEAGQSRWGSMEVERAVEQVKMAADAANDPSTGEKPSSLYAQRNARVVAAAEAGKSRWGSMEVERASREVTEKEPIKLPATTSLEERVNLGARLVFS